MLHADRVLQPKHFRQQCFFQNQIDGFTCPCRQLMVATRYRWLQSVNGQEMAGPFDGFFGPAAAHGVGADDGGTMDELEAAVGDHTEAHEDVVELEGYANDYADVVDPIDGDGNEDDDCHLVEVIESDANATEEQLAAAAERCSRLNQMGQQKTLPPIIVRALPTLLARANKEVARYDAIFHSTRTLANRTNLWEMTTHYRCDIPLRHLPNRQCRDD